MQSKASERAKEKRKASQPTKVLQKARKRKRKFVYADRRTNDARLEEFLKAYFINKQTYKKNLMDAIRAFDEKEGKKHKYAEIYRNAGISKQVFYEMLKRPPKKDTLIKIALALEVTLKKAEELLESAGYYLTYCSYKDLIFRFCLKKGIFDILKINEWIKEKSQS